MSNGERWRDLLSELLPAEWLSRQNVRYEFGSPGIAQPDLVLAGYGFGIEVGLVGRGSRGRPNVGLIRDPPVGGYCPLSRHQGDGAAADQRVEFVLHLP